MQLSRYLFFLICSLFITNASFAQIDSVFQKGLKISLDKTGSRYFQFSIVGQTWVRFNQNNPGSKLNDDIQNASLDIGIRRARVQMIGNIHPRFLIYAQFGINNFNAVTARKPQLFFHDVAMEYHAVKKFLTIGGGLTGWTGFLRYSSPSVSSILMADAPLYQQATNDINDQFLRKLSLYFKGKIYGFDYRVVVSDPFILQTSAFFDPAISTDAKFSPKGHSLQVSSYISYQFFDQESNLLPYSTGSYLGKKKVLNVGIGAQFQPKATWSLLNGTDTIHHPMFLAGVDVFYDTPIGENGKYGLTVYGAYSYTDFGPRYLRNLAPMNPVNGLDLSKASLNGSGNGYPAIGTGHTGFVQAGLVLPSRWFGKTGITLQPYVAAQVSFFDKLNGHMSCFDAGFNWLFMGHHSKLSIHYQNRPVFDAVTFRESRRLNGFLVQYQIFI